MCNFIYIFSCALDDIHVRRSLILTSYFTGHFSQLSETGIGNEIIVFIFLVRHLPHFTVSRANHIYKHRKNVHLKSIFQCTWLDAAFIRIGIWYDIGKGKVRPRFIYKWLMRSLSHTIFEYGIGQNIVKLIQFTNIFKLPLLYVPA